MKNNRFIKKGYTLIELMIIMGMLITVITVAYSSGLVNIKILNKINNQTIVQQQVETGMNTIVKSIMGAEEVKEISPEITTGDMSEIDYIIFKMLGDNYLKIELDGETLKIVRSNEVDEISTRALAYGVHSLGIALIGSDRYEDYDACKGLEIQIGVKEKETEITLENDVYFRNWNMEEE